MNIAMTTNFKPAATKNGTAPLASCIAAPAKHPARYNPMKARRLLRGALSFFRNFESVVNWTLQSRQHGTKEFVEHSRLVTYDSACYHLQKRTMLSASVSGKLEGHSLNDSGFQAGPRVRILLTYNRIERGLAETD